MLPNEDPGVMTIIGYVCLLIGHPAQGIVQPTENGRLTGSCPVWPTAWNVQSIQHLNQESALEASSFIYCRRTITLLLALHVGSACQKRLSPFYTRDTP